MTKVTELTIRAQAAIKYPGWRVDFAGPATVVLTSIMGRQRVVEVRRRRKRRKGPIVRIDKWIRSISRQAVEWVAVSVIWLFGLWMVCRGIVALALL